MTEDTLNKFNISTATGAVLIDVVKAFDRVWHDNLINKFINYGYPNWMTKLTRWYLSNRTFHIHTNKKDLTKRKIQAGVPQGSILGPLLFNIYISDIPKTKWCKIAQYADDTMIYTHHRNPDAISRRHD